jgi:serine phosphatase RsbU (regulator of sigma subunit)
VFSEADMRILVAWDDSGEGDLLQLYLGAGENESLLVRTAAEVLAQVAEGGWDVVLQALTFPSNPDEGFALFDKLGQVAPDVPVVLGCRQTEMLNLPRFMNRGLRFYVIRDDRGDFVFLTLASLESAVTATRAEESRKLAERLREEMDGVRRLQESVIPKGIKAPAGYRIAAHYEPAQMSVVGGQPVVMAGGDYYDLFCPDDRTLVVILGDAAGHGLKACMSIMTMHTLIRMFRGDQYRDTGALVAEVNERLCENSIVQSGGGFITLFYAAIDTITHTMSWTSAGHPLALLQDLKTNEVVQVGTEADGGFPLGISHGLEYPGGKVVVPANSRLLIYTDGLTDAFPPGQEKLVPFGVRGIQTSLKASQACSTDDALEQLFQASHRYTAGSGRHDDTSVVMVDRGTED